MKLLFWNVLFLMVGIAEGQDLQNCIDSYSSTQQSDCSTTLDTSGLTTEKLDEYCKSDCYNLVQNSVDDFLSCQEGVPDIGIPGGLPGLGGGGSSLPVPTFPDGVNPVDDNLPGVIDAQCSKNYLTGDYCLMLPNVPDFGSIDSSNQSQVSSDVCNFYAESGCCFTSLMTNNGVEPDSSWLTTCGWSKMPAGCSKPGETINYYLVNLGSNISPEEWNGMRDEEQLAARLAGATDVATALQIDPSEVVPGIFADSAGAGVIGIDFAVLEGVVPDMNAEQMQAALANVEWTELSKVMQANGGAVVTTVVNTVTPEEDTNDANDGKTPEKSSYQKLTPSSFACSALLAVSFIWTSM